MGGSGMKARLGMKNYYSTVDGITLTYGDLRKGELTDTIPVYFEREDGRGDFDFAEGAIPVCHFSRSRGFSEWELEGLRAFLRNNMLLIFDKARGLE